MTPAEALAVAAEIRAHWPRPELGDADVVALAGALDRAGVTAAAALEAIDAILADGADYQPRAPQIIAAVRERRTREAAWRERVPEDRHLPAFASMGDAELRREVERVGSLPIRELVERSINAIRARQADAS